MALLARLAESAAIALILAGKATQAVTTQPARRSGAIEMRCVNGVWKPVLESKP